MFDVWRRKRQYGNKSLSRKRGRKGDDGEIESEKSNEE
jgi:hypothetical protein